VHRDREVPNPFVTNQSIKQVGRKMHVHNENKVFQLKGGDMKYDIKSVDKVQLM
jgi:hypothetical protein